MKPRKQQWVKNLLDQVQGDGLYVVESWGYTVPYCRLREILGKMPDWATSINDYFYYTDFKDLNG